jgi:hypothetical protein
MVSQVSTSPRAVLWWKSRLWLRTLRHSFARARRSRRRSGTASPLHRHQPTGPSGAETGFQSVTTTTYQRRCSRFTCKVLTRPTTGRSCFTFTRPTAWKLAYAHRPLSAACHVDAEDRIEAAESLLLGGERVAALSIRVGGADLLQLGRLVAVGDADLAQALGVAALLESGVVQVTVVGQHPHRAAFLWTGRVGAKPIGAFQGLPFSDGEICLAMYQRIVARDTPPTEVTKYAGTRASTAVSRLSDRSR